MCQNHVAKDTEELCNTNFTVRRKTVLTAFRWLRRPDKACKCVTIAKGNLEWMDGKAEAELPCDVEEDNLDGETEVEEDRLQL